MSPRWHDRRSGEMLALDTGGGPLARFWVTALAGKVDFATSKPLARAWKIYLPRTVNLPEVEFEWKIPQWSNALERNRARTYFQAYAAAAALYFVERALGRSSRRPAGNFHRIQSAQRCHRLRISRSGARGAIASRGDHAMARSPTIIRIPHVLERQPARLGRLPGPTKTPSRIRRFSRKTTRTTSKASTSCARSAVSIRVCLAACTCTWAPGERFRCGTCRCSGSNRRT